MRGYDELRTLARFNQKPGDCQNHIWMKTYLRFLYTDQWRWIRVQKNS